MAEPFKNMYNEQFFNRFTKDLQLSVHPFIIKYPDKMMQQMLVWSKHEHWGVRRLASEGVSSASSLGDGFAEFERKSCPDHSNSGKP